ncbi:MAG: hypothetical protein GY913_06345 [Proteobacteria bacterium]|nr:hypothetical protein [Pseudomonadota bacterium]MCP4916527.1 hypothetical protein [Pseudomonadota bacterium]
MRSRSPDERNARLMIVGFPVMLAAVIGGAFALLGVASMIGGTAAGETAEIRITSSCPDEWAQLVEKRATDVGIGDLAVAVEGSDAVLTGVLPGLEDDLTAIPALLTRTGELEIYAAETIDDAPSGEPLATDVDVVNSWLQMGMMGHPFVQLELQPHALKRVQDSPAPVLLLVVDGEVLDTFDADREPDDDDLRIQPALLTVEDEVRTSTDLKIVLQHGKAPCAVEDVSITTEG